MKVIDITMKYKKSTPGTHVFIEDLTPAEQEFHTSAIPSLYIRKSALTEPAQKIRITVEILK